MANEVKHLQMTDGTICDIGFGPYLITVNLTNVKSLALEQGLDLSTVSKTTVIKDLRTNTTVNTIELNEVFNNGGIVYVQAYIDTNMIVDTVLHRFNTAYRATDSITTKYEVNLVFDSNATLQGGNISNTMTRYIDVFDTSKSGRLYTDAINITNSTVTNHNENGLAEHFRNGYLWPNLSIRWTNNGVLYTDVIEPIEFYYLDPDNKRIDFSSISPMIPDNLSYKLVCKYSVTHTDGTTITVTKTLNFNNNTATTVISSPNTSNGTATIT